MRHAAAVATRAVLLATLAQGCMMIDNISPQNRLADQVHMLNDEVRWGRVDLAAHRVAPTHRADFLAQHRGWGQMVHVADADVTNLELGLAEGRAASTVTYAWIDERTMELHSTSVRQTWRGEGEGFVLIEEEITGGEPGLLVGAPVAPGTDGDPVSGDPSLGSTSGDEDLFADDPPRGSSSTAPAPSASDAADDAADDDTATTATASPPRHRDAQGMLVP